MKVSVVAIALLLIIGLLSYYNALRYANINKNPIDSLNVRGYQTLPRVKSSNRVIISLTTIPTRIDKAKYTLASILDQTMRVDEIRMYVPEMSLKGIPYTIPEWMKALSYHIPQFKIIRCDKDWGPATKVIPAILDCKKERRDIGERGGGENTIIIYLDDDMIYNRDTVEILIDYSNRFPDRAICNQGWDVERWNKGDGIGEKLQRGMYHLGKYLPDPQPFQYRYVDVMQGFSGCLVKPSFFDEEKLVRYEMYPREVIFVDDVYISGMLNDSGVKRISTETPSAVPYLHELFYGFLLRRATDSLSSVENNDLRNDRIACDCFSWKKQY